MQTLRRCVLACALTTGCLFAGPCGITTLQLQDFLTTTLIRTGVTTVAAAVEAAIVEGAQEPDGGQP
jgi:hypothetical protein